MSPDNQRIAIASICKWKPPFVMTTQCEWVDTSCPHQTRMLSDPLEDLNAMREAIRVSAFGMSRCEELNECLKEILKRDWEAAVKSGKNLLLLCDWYTWHASAAQLAEAFLRTLGKWEPAP